MPNGNKRLSATFAASISLAASGLVAAPAQAQTGGGGGYYYGCDDITTGSTGGYGYGYGCCRYEEGWGWYRMYTTHWEACDPPYQSPDEPADRPQEQTDPSGQ
jgi:hypothetical protein